MNVRFTSIKLARHRSIIILLLLFITVLIIYYPVFYAEYLYTDEATQLWFSGNGVHLTWLAQGRGLSYLLFKWLFSHVHTIHNVIYLRIFSLAGWMICLPAWYYIINDVLAKNKLPVLLAPVALIYLVCMPPFAVSIGWASCLELFIACTAGLVSGYALYITLHKKRATSISIALIICCVMAGTISLFTYQNGFGCFFITFFIHYIANRKFTKSILAGICVAMIIYVLYFLLYKYSLYITETAPSNRGSFAANPLQKLLFLAERPLYNAFHFTWLFNERSVTGIVCYALILTGWLVLYFKSMGAKRLTEKIFYLAGLFIFFALVYLPSLLVAENYASNRTMLALNMIVLLLVAKTFFGSIKKPPHQYLAATVVIFFFILNGWYNFHVQFTNPLVKEFSTIKTQLYGAYTSKTNAIYFIRPPEDAFADKYKIVASWDEFGVPSTAKPWTAEPLFKQLISEQTGNRQTAEKLLVKTWESYDAFVASGELVTAGVLFIDGPALIQNQ